MSSHALLSPSAASRWMNCTPAPRLEAEFTESASEYAAEGTLAHAMCELAVRKKFVGVTARSYNTSLKKLKADPLWNEEMLHTAATYLEHLEEQAKQFKSIPYVAVEVRVDISDYVPEAYGTCDCIMIGGSELVITDYKHGKGVPVSAVNNPQMMLYALGALKMYKPIYGNMISNVSMYIDQPRLDIYEGHSMTVESLLKWGETEVKPKAAAAFEGTGEFVPGEWCRFCKAKTCRARANGQTALEDFKDCLLPTEENLQGIPTSPLLTFDEVGKLLHRGKALVEWYESLKEFALATCLAGGTIPGWKAVEGRSVRAWADQDKALEAILAAGHPRELVYETVPKSLAQLEKYIGKAAFSELMADYIVQPPGKPTLAPESDNRPAFNKAASDFAGVS